MRSQKAKNMHFKIREGHKGDMWFLTRDVNASTLHSEIKDFVITKVFYNKDVADDYLHSIRFST